MTQKELFDLAAQNGMDEEEAIDAVLASIKAPFALAAFKIWKADNTNTQDVATEKMFEQETGRWVQAAQRQPELEGVYSVMRRGQGGRPSYLDRCTWIDGTWRNSRGVVIATVNLWWEVGEGA